MTVIQQKSFAGGVMGPLMLGRSDDEKYKAGLKVCQNFICLPQGAVQNRAGFEYVRECKYADKQTRLIGFIYSRTQTWVLEFGEKYIRFHTEGTTLLNEDGSVYEVATPYSSEDVMDLHYAQSADVMTFVHHKYPPMELKRYSIRDWRFTECEINPTLSPPQNATAIKYTTGENETNADKYTFKYCVTALNSERTVESEKSNICYCTANIYNNGTTIMIRWSAVEGATYYRVYKNIGGVYCYMGETEGLELIDNNISGDEDYTPPRLDNPFNASNGIASITVTNGGSGYSNVKGGIVGVTGLNYNYEDKYIKSVKFYDESNSGTGGSVELIKSTWTTSHQGYDNSGDSGYHYTYYVYHLQITGVKVLSIGRGYVKPKVIVTVNPSGERGKDKYDTKITIDLSVTDLIPTAYLTDATGSGAELSVVVTNGSITAINIERHGSGYTKPTVAITAPQGSGAKATATVNTTADYPQAVTYFEQRRVFASTPTQPQVIWMSKSGTESNFSYCIPIRSDDRIKFKIASRERHEIFHLVPLNRLLVFTEAGEWVVTSSSSDALTPSSVQVKSQAFVGANMVMPIVVNNSVLYASQRGGHIRELGYNYNAGGYITADLSIRCPQLFDQYNVLDSAFSRAPYPIAWFTSTSGSLLGLTYIPEQNIGAWHEHTTDGRFESVTSVSEGDVDVVYCVVLRHINGQDVRFVERMAERDKSNLSDAFFVDCGATYRGEATDTVTGLTWLEGETVSILADGAEKPQQVVTDGKITLDVPARVITIGLPIEAKVTTLPAIIPLQTGGDAGSNQKNVSSVFLRVYKTSGIYVGPEDGELVEYKQRTEETLGQPPETVSGGVNIDIEPEWNDTGSVTISQEAPLPITILSISLDMELGG